MSNLEQFRKDYPRMFYHSNELDGSGRIISDVDQDNLFLRRLKEEKFTEEQIDKIIEIVTDVCNGCFDNDIGCRCNRDD